jgi:gamma-glutamyltranspeptidase / glutathione hydrolase
MKAALISSVKHGDRPAPNSQGGRSPVLALNGMVATSQPLASVAALAVLREGGNAIDGAITAAAVLNVVEPMMTGIGGDMFCIAYLQSEKKPIALNGSGWAGSRASIDFFQSRGMYSMPVKGMQTVSVPGAVAGWFKLHEKYGKLPMQRLLAPAIQYAEDGFPVSEIIAGQWQRNEAILRETPDASWTYLIDGRAPRHGEVFRNPALARSLRLISEQGRDAFYKGEIGQKLVDFSDRNDGLLVASDLADFDASWVEPSHINYRGYDLYEIGENTQGTTALEIMNIIEGFDLKETGHNSAGHVHLMVEAKKLAFADRDLYIADPRMSDVRLHRLLSKSYAEERRALIDRDRAMLSPKPGIIEHGDTVYLTVVDRDRNAVSFINSIFFNFGSGMVADDTGIVLQNRGALFELDPYHPNRIEPRKRPFHTLIPAMVLKNNQPYFSFGVMGGDMQPQGHAQVLVNVIDFGMDAQQAGEAARFRHFNEGLALESGFGMSVRNKLSEMGHRVIESLDSFGGYQGIMIDPSTGVLMGGTDIRKDGVAIGW